jgi:hypothetical protein
MAAGKVMYFPKGICRFAQQNPANDSAIFLSALSNVGVYFEPGAELVMDNQSSGSGTSAGVTVYGSCSNVLLENVRVRWASTPSRSDGDGFRFLGYPSDSAPAGGWTTTTGPVSNVQLVNCTTINAPQTGAIFMGCSDIRVVNFRAESTLGDGLHVNACRRVNVAGYTAVNTGDDGLALVTYYDASAIWQSSTGPFNQPSLGQWSNYDSAATNIVVWGGNANGLRISGSYNVAVSNIVADSKSNAGIMIDSIVGATSYQASQGISISNAVIQSCPFGVYIPAQNINSGSASAFWTFGVRLSGLTINNSSNWSIRTQGDGSTSSVVSGIHVDGVKITTGSGGGGNGSVGFSSIRDSSIRNLWMKTGNGAQLLFTGQDSALTGALSTLPRHNVVVDNVRNDGGTITFQDLFGLTIGTVRSINSPGDGIGFLRVKQVMIDSIKVSLANRANTGTVRGLWINKGLLMEVAKVVVEHDSNTTSTWRSLELGGGTQQTSLWRPRISTNSSTPTR